MVMRRKERVLVEIRGYRIFEEKSFNVGIYNGSEGSLVKV